MPATQTDTEPAARSAVVARQPIFDRRRQVIAEELLYRGPREADGTAVTARVLIDALAHFDFDALRPRVPLFVNMPRAALDWTLEQMLPAGRLVLEVLEDVTPDDALLAAVGRRRAAGFRIALDDFVWSPAHEPLLECADYVKIDVLAEGDRLAETVARCRRPGLVLLAEKVETQAQLEACERLGFDAFQGYVFCRPANVATSALPAPSVVLARLVTRLQDPAVRHAELALLIKQDATLAYQVLRLSNSPLHGLRRRVASVEDALVILGTDVVRNWAAILLLARLAHSKPRELLELAIARATMCVRAGEPRGVGPRETLYTVGLFSMLEALLDRDMREIVAGLSLADPVRDALVDRAGAFGNVLATVIAFEQGRWTTLEAELSDRALAELGEAQAEGLAAGRAALGAR